MRTNIACCKVHHTNSPSPSRGAFAAARAGWSDPCIFLFFCRFGIFHPRSHDLKHTHLLVPAARFPHPRFAPLLHSPRIEGWAERRSATRTSHVASGRPRTHQTLKLSVLRSPHTASNIPRVHRL